MCRTGASELTRYPRLASKERTRTWGTLAGHCRYGLMATGALMDSLAADVKPYNVNVKSILPSIIDTAANRKAMPNADFSKWPKPEEIARVILFLCSEEARVIHGAAIPVYGRS